MLVASQAQVVTPQYGGLPLYFEPNVGQTDPSARFLARANGYRLFATDSETVLAMNDARRPAIHMKLAGSRAGRFEPLEKLPGVSNYFLGNDPSKWRTDVPQYARLKRRDVYPAIDLVFYGNQRQIEYDFVLRPGADASAIRLAYQGIDSMRVDRNGDLVLLADGREFRQKRPLVYQEDAQGRREIAGGYEIDAEASEVRLALGDYDRSRTLVVDPAFVYSAYQNGSADDRAAAVAVDAFGNAFITGRTASADFPIVTPAAQPNYAGGTDAFVAKLDPTGTALLYATFLGGNDMDFGAAIAVDASNNAYVAGGTLSTNFPVKSAVQPNKPGGPDGFVVKLGPSGAIIFSTYIGGSATDFAFGIAVDIPGNIYVVGSAASGNFPVVNAVQATKGATIVNAFVAKLDPTGSSFLFSTFLGGSNGTADVAFAVTLGLDGGVWVAGVATSTDFPAKNPIQLVYGGGIQDTFLAKLNNSGSALLFSTFLGGLGSDSVNGLAVDPSGNILVAGSTSSPDFPLLSPLQPNLTEGAAGANAMSAFVTKLSPTNPALLYSTYFAGTGSVGIASDAAGNATIAGLSPFPNPSPVAFPLIYNLPAAVPSNGYLAQLNPTGNTLLYSTFISDPKGLSPGNNTILNNPNAVTLDSTGNAYLAGYANGPGLAGTDNGSFVMKISQATNRCGATATVSPQSFPASGGTGTVTFTNPIGCAFPVASIASWVQTGASQQGSGQTSGQFNFTVAANSAPARKGSILVNGVGFTISQDTGQMGLLGAWESPLTMTSGAGVVAISGWALSDSSITVEIRVANSGPTGTGVSYLVGNATFVTGARPDIQSQYPNYPNSASAGWSYALLTNVLPNSDGSLGKGNGTYQLTVNIRDAKSRLLTFDSRTLVINNASSTKPFGTIDTPAPGATASGSSYKNWGWALTPQPATIPLNGSTIIVFLDGNSLGPLTAYNLFRSDVVATLPGYQNSSGPVGYSIIDTTKLTNGQHVIAWNVIDNATRSNTAGSRTFTVSNSGTVTAPVESAEAVRSREPRNPEEFGGEVVWRTGYDLSAPFERLLPERTGRYEIAIEQLGRLEVSLRHSDSSVAGCSGYLAYAGERLPLPVGSTLDQDTCTFYWQVDPSFLGDYPLVFASDHGDIAVTIRVQPQLLAVTQDR